MKPRWKRIPAFLMVLMLMLSSQSSVWAQIEATPQPVQTEEASAPAESSGDQGTPATDEENTEATETSTDVSEEPETDDPSVQPQEQISGYVLEPFTYDATTSQMTVTLTFPVGFSAQANPGFDPDFISLTSVGYGDGTFSVDSLVSASSNEFSVAIDQSTNSIKLTTVNTFTVTTSPLVLTLVFDAPITWNACVTAASNYTPEMYLELYNNGSPWYYHDFTVYGDECIGTGYPVAEWVEYDIRDQEIGIYLDVPETIPAGSVVTITYQTDKLVASTAPVLVYSYNSSTGMDEPIGTAVAADGVITITFNQSGDISGWDDWAQFTIPATLLFTCEPEQSGTETGEFVFVADPGGTFTQDSAPILCNANAPSKTGEWSTDSEDNDIIIWTIDTGDMFTDSWMNDWNYSGTFTFDCNTIDIKVITGDDYDYDCYTDGFWVDFYGETPLRGTVTIAAYPNPEAVSYLNCATIYSSPSGQGPGIASNTTGWGGKVCYELFPEGGGDFIEKTVDKATAVSGETVTYTVVVTTTSDTWSDITLTDPLPEGFTLDPASVTCAVDGEEFAGDPCYTLNGNTLTVTALPASVDMDGWIDYQSGPATITLTFSGIVTGEPGDTITNQACSMRTYETNNSRPESITAGDPTIPGGGQICATASTRILGAVTPAPVTFVDFDCDVTPEVGVPEDGNGISYTTEGDIVPGGTVTVYATIDPDINTWGDLTGTGWMPVDGQSHVISQTFHISDKDCRTPVVPIVTFTEATCTSDAKAEASPVTGVGYGTVTEIGAGKTYILYATIDLTKNVWGDLTGTGWVPVDGDPSSVRITHTFAEAPDCRTPLVPGITFTEATCTTDATLSVEPVDGIGYATVTEIGAGKTVVIYATIDITENFWGDLTGTGWVPVDGDPSTVVVTHTFADAPDCRTPLVPGITFTEATCTTDATLSVEPVDGIGYATVTEIGAGKTVVIYATIDITKNVWGDLTGTGWVPVDGDPSTVVVTHTFAEAPDCTTPSPSPSPTVPAATPTEPGATPTEPAATATATQAVTGLPNTGSGNDGIGTALLGSALVMVAAAVVLAGIRVRRSGSES